MVHDVSLNDLHTMSELPDINSEIYFWDWEGNIHVGIFSGSIGEFKLFVDLDPDSYRFFYTINDIPYWKYKPDNLINNGDY